MRVMVQLLSISKNSTIQVYQFNYLTTSLAVHNERLNNDYPHFPDKNNYLTPLSRKIHLATPLRFIINYQAPSLIPEKTS